MDNGYKMVNDLIDTLINHKSISNVVDFPKMITNTTGQELFGYSTSEFIKAAIYMSNSFNNIQFDSYMKLADNVKMAININMYALIYLSSMFRNYSIDTGVYDTFLDIYSKHFNLDKTELVRLLDCAEQIYEDTWCKMVPNEDDLTSDMLTDFYNALPPWIASTSIMDFKVQNPLTMAYRAIPIVMMENNGYKTAFDFGGNDGLSMAALSRFATERATLIDINQGVLELAKHRDSILNITNIEYVNTLDVIKNQQDYAECYDFGVCTEVLEHLYDVEETVKLIASLLKKNGMLYLSASFQLPQPSHLIKNRKYYGFLETELYNRHGLYEINVGGIPFPKLNNIKYLVKA